MLPLTQTVGHSVYHMGENSMGDPTPVREPPVDVLVFGWYLTGGTEQGTDGHVWEVDYDAVVLAPASLTVSPHDQFVLGGRTFEVAGPPGDWNHGPWWNPGAIQVKCKAVV